MLDLYHFQGLTRTLLSFKFTIETITTSIKYSLKIKIMKTGKFGLLIVLGIVFIRSCNNDDDDENYQAEINGEYIGFFERNGNITNVELNFVDGSYSGESRTEKFPAICNGNYSISNNSIEFENVCTWKADFDWTLILGENWNYTIENNILIMTKSNGDKYTLTKQ
jgi:hypothetical protein